MFYKAAQAFDLFGLKILPHGLNIVIGLQVEVCIHIADTMLLELLVDLVHTHGVKSQPAVLIADTHQVQVGHVVLLHGAQVVNEPEGQQLSLRFLQGFGERGEGDTKSNHPVVLIQNDWDELNDCQTKITLDIGIYLLFAQGNSTVQIPVGFFDNIK
ncbi:hypothetical protein SDC9_161188 [bioreactor metagenome]|uniref:Uncharacterized protein n=1 Tax=bioreactor metagenome TaxID=1076179 RepID=A0A645FJY1_9ZZZZ